MRIVQVVPTLTVAGAETFVVQLAQHQLDTGLDVHLLCLTDGGPLWERMSGALRERTTIIGKKHRWDARVLPRAVRHLRKLRPDVVHTHLFTALSWGGTATKLASGAGWVHTKHAAHEEELRYVRVIERTLCRGVDRLVACSPSAGELLRTKGYSDRVTVIENGIPLSGRPTSALAGDPPVVGTVGRMVPIKGQRTLIEAVELLRDRGVDVQLVMVGDGELRADLEALVDSARLRDRVRFVGRVADVPQRLAGLDLFVLPSLSEALPLALLEACAAGLPVLVTSQGGAGIVVEQGAGGWTVNPGDPGSLAERLERFTRLSPPERAALGRKSLDLVNQRYSLEACAARYRALYEGLR